MIRYENGVPVEMTPAEVTAFQAGVVPAPNPVPASVSNFQGRTMLRQLGLFDAVQDFITAIPDELQRAIAQDAFERGEFVRSSTFISSFAQQASLSSDYVDELFRQAEGITL